MDFAWADEDVECRRALVDFLVESFHAPAWPG